jgi:hypothetical protein
MVATSPAVSLSQKYSGFSPGTFWPCVAVPINLAFCWKKFPAEAVEMRRRVEKAVKLVNFMAGR